MKIPYGPYDTTFIWTFLIFHNLRNFHNFCRLFTLVNCFGVRFLLGLGSKLNLFGLCGVVFLICESSNENYGFCVILSRLILGIPVVYKSISKLDQNIIEIVFKIHLGQKPITFTRIWILSGHPIYGYIYKERHKTWNNSKKSI